MKKVYINRDGTFTKRALREHERIKANRRGDILQPPTRAA